MERVEGIDWDMQNFPLIFPVAEVKQFKSNQNETRCNKMEIERVPKRSRMCLVGADWITPGQVHTIFAPIKDNVHYCNGFQSRIVHVVDCAWSARPRHFFHQKKLHFWQSRFRISWVALLKMHMPVSLSGPCLLLLGTSICPLSSLHSFLDSHQFQVHLRRTWNRITHSRIFFFLTES